MMRVKATNGTDVEISADTMKAVAAEVERRWGNKNNSPENSSAANHAETPAHHHHHFMIGGKETALTEHEMKEISNAWWNKTGKSQMVTFFERYQNKAAENIRKALCHCQVPVCEKEVKAAIAQAISSNDPCLMAEVIFEAMEWESAYFGLNSVSED